MNGKESPLIISRLVAMIYAVKEFLLCLANLNTTNTKVNLSIVVFDNNAEILLDNVVLNKDANLNSILAMLDKVQTKGCTDMYEGLKTGISLVKKGCDYYNSLETKIVSNHVILLTDGDSNRPRPGVNDIQTLKSQIQSRFSINVHAIGFSCYSNMKVLHEIQREFETTTTCGVLAYIHDATTGFEIFKGLAAFMITSFENNKAMLGTNFNKNTPIVKEYNKLIAAIDSKSDKYDSGFIELHNDLETIVQNIQVMGTPYNLDCPELKMGLLQNQDDFQTWGERYVRDLSNKYLLGISVNPKSQGPLQFLTPNIQNLLVNMDVFEKQLGQPLQSINKNWKPVVKTANLTPEEIEEKKRELLDKAARLQSSGYSVAEIRSGGCFDINATVKVFDNNNILVDLPASLIKKGMKVLSTNNKIATVEAVFVTNNAGHLSKVFLTSSSSSSLIITNYHPIFENGNWVHPINSKNVTINSFATCNTVVTVMFDKKSVDEGCLSIFANGFEVITVGHEVKNDKVAHHCFYGNHATMTLYKEYLDLCDGNGNGDNTRENIVDFVSKYLSVKA